jgi:aminopeptidase N
MELVGGLPRTLTFEGCDRPVKANYGDTGYYRVHYDDADLKALGAAIHQLAAADRVSLMADAWAMVLAGLTAPAAYLELTRQLSSENELAVWDSVVGSLRFIDDQYADSPDREGFRVYARSLLRTAFDRVGWEPRASEDTEAALLRSRLIVELAALGDLEITAEARRKFAVLIRDHTAVVAALRGPIARAVAYSADRQMYDDLLRLAREQDSEQERMLYYNALAGARAADLIDLTVQIALRDPKLPPAETLPFLEQAAKESGDPDRVWRLVSAHRNDILNRLSGLQRQQALSRIARASANPAVAFELRWADLTRADRGLRRFADEVAEEIELKADLKTTLVPAVRQWIGQQRQR